jgi:uncharacterized DUF497 family protein
MLEQVVGFDWDDANRGKCQRHGVSLVEIEALFASSPGVASDLGHSGGAERFVAVCRTGAGRPLFVAFTFRVKDGRRLIQPVSARYLHTKEVARYAAHGA